MTNLLSSKAIDPQDRLIVALDFPDAESARALVTELGDAVVFYKIGLELFMTGGYFDLLHWLVAQGKKVFVDLKFFDVPETVKLAMMQLRGRGITFATVHGNDPILRAAAAAKDEVKLLAVTVLTSFGQEDMEEIFGGPVNLADLVYRRARRALALGCDGVVSSGLEVPRLRSELGDRFLVVTPGIRPGSNREIDLDDQKRIVTAGRAIANGADHIVVGRPISTASDPLRAVEAMQKEIVESLPRE